MPVTVKDHLTCDSNEKKKKSVLKIVVHPVIETPPGEKKSSSNTLTDA